MRLPIREETRVNKGHRYFIKKNVIIRRVIVMAASFPSIDGDGKARLLRESWIV